MRSMARSVRDGASTLIYGDVATMQAVVAPVLP
jgi:hypothetical protein